MDCEQYIRNYLSFSSVSAKTACEVIINETLDKYRKSQYVDLTDMLYGAKKIIDTYQIIANGITAKDFGEKIGVTDSAARRRLDSMRGVNKFTDKRPYIYTIKQT